MSKGAIKPRFTQKSTVETAGKTKSELKMLNYFQYIS